MNDSAARPVHRFGDRGVLVDCTDGTEARGLLAALEANPPRGVADVVVGARTVLVRTRGDVGDALLVDLATRPVPAPTSHVADEVLVDVVYDGADLPIVAAHLGTDEAAVVRWHTSTVWTAGFVGFAPGFAYLEPEEDAREVPRRPEPRTVVPAGSVALAGRWSAVYPRRSPGGWQLVGRTDHVLWDLGQDPPAVLRAGTRVRFRAVRPRVVAVVEPDPTAARGSGAIVVDRVRLEIVAPGPLTVVEDLGRSGSQGLGVPSSGALDRGAAVTANRLVGNPRGAAVLETLGDLVLRPTSDVVVALTGAQSATEVVDEAGEARTVAPGRPFLVPGESTLRVGPPVRGARVYVAVRGGVDAEPVLGSRSTDLLSGLGPPPLHPGDVLPVGADATDAVALADDVPEPADLPIEVRAVPGPRHDWFDDDGSAFWTTAWRVTADSNRVGLRLDGGSVPRHSSEELESEPMLPGAVQVPPGGRPVVLLADHPTTGGYPVVAVVVAADLDRLAQARPGDVVRFVAR